MTKNWVLLLLSIFSFQLMLSSQTTSIKSYLEQEKIQAQSTNDGLFYSIDKPGNGPSPKAGDYVKLNFKGRLLNGKVFDQSEKEDPFVFQLGRYQVIRGLDLGLGLFKVGSKGTLYVPPKLGYGKTGAGNVIPPNSPLAFDIELLEIMDQSSYDNYMIALEEKERKEFEAHKRKQFMIDKKLISEYASSHKLKTTRSNSGLSYMIKKKGKGDVAQPGDKLVVHYEGFLIDDTSFDSSFDRDPFEFVLGKKKVIEGWDEGLQHFKKGTEGWLLIPSQMAYGPRSIVEKDISIPANSILIFKIKVLDIKRNPITAGKK